MMVYPADQFPHQEANIVEDIDSIWPVRESELPKLHFLLIYLAIWKI